MRPLHAEDVSDVETAVPLKNATVFVPLSTETPLPTLEVLSHLVVPYTGKAKSTSYYICTYPTCEPPKGFVQKSRCTQPSSPSSPGSCSGLSLLHWLESMAHSRVEGAYAGKALLPSPVPHGHYAGGVKEVSKSPMLEKLNPPAAPSGDAAFATSSAASSFMQVAQAYPSNLDNLLFPQLTGPTSL